MRPHRAHGFPLLLALAGCDLAGGCLELTLELPELPRVWSAAFGAPGYRLGWRDPSGEPRVLTGETWAAAEAAATVTVAAGAYTPVLAWLEGPGVPVGLRPAGAIVPVDVDPERMTVRLTFEQGAAAWVLERLLGPAAAIGADSLDVERLARDIRETGQGDPWRVDLDGLIASVIAGDPDVRRRDTVPVCSPGAAALIWDNPFTEPLAPGGPPVDTPTGFHRLYGCNDGGVWTGATQVLWVDPRETIWVSRGRSPRVLSPRAPPR